MNISFVLFDAAFENQLDGFRYVTYGRIDWIFSDYDLSSSTCNNPFLDRMVPLVWSFRWMWHHLISSTVFDVCSQMFAFYPCDRAFKFLINSVGVFRMENDCRTYLYLVEKHFKRWLIRYFNRKPVSHCTHARKILSRTLQAAASNRQLMTLNERGKI